MSCSLGTGGSVACRDIRFGSKALRSSTLAMLGLLYGRNGRTGGLIAKDMVVGGKVVGG